jgi:hypothetical protein
MIFEDFIQWAEQYLKTWQEFRGLGGRARFKARYVIQDSSISIINKPDKKYSLDKDDLNKVFKRYTAASPKKKHMTSYYTDPKWDQAPNRISPPYIAAIIKYWDENT